MAEIPIAAIPNAPRAGQAPPMIRPGGVSVNLGPAAQSLISPTADPAAFGGAVAGLGAIGQSIANLGAGGDRIGAMIEHKNKLIADFQDDVSLATYDRKIGEEFARFKGEMVGKSEDQWLPEWQKRFAEISPKIGGELQFSPIGAQKLAIYNERTLGAQNVELIASSTRQAIDRGTGELLAQADRRAQSGDLDGAGAALGTLVARGALRQDQADAKFQEYKTDMQEGDLAQAIVNSPRAVQQDMEAALKEGKPPKTFPWMTDKAQMRIARDRARSEGNTMEVEARQEANDDILGRTITSPKQLREKYTGRLGEGALASLEKSLNKEVAYNPEIVSKLRTRIANADFANDLEMKEFNALTNELETMIPERLRGPLSSELYQTWSSTVKEEKSKTPQQSFTASLMREIDKFGEQGLLLPGGTGVGEKKNDKGKIIDPEQHAKVWEKAEAVKLQMRDWLNKNPEADPKAARQQFMDLIGADAADAAAKAFEKARADSSWGVWEWTTPGLVTKPLRNARSKQEAKTIEDLNAAVDEELSLPNADADPDNLISQ